MTIKVDKAMNASSLFTQENMPLARYEHSLNRRMIGDRALLAALTNAIPAGGVSQWLTQEIQRDMATKIAKSYCISIDEDALEALIFEDEQSPSFVALDIARFSKLFLGRWRNVFWLYAASKQARYAAQTFMTYMLFDYYCTNLHDGETLKHAQAQRIKTIIDETIESSDIYLFVETFRDSVEQLTHGLTQRLSKENRAKFIDANKKIFAQFRSLSEMRWSDNTPTDIVRTIGSQALNTLQSATSMIDIQIGSIVDPYMRRMSTRFESSWYHDTETPRSDRQNNSDTSSRMYSQTDETSMTNNRTSDRDNNMSGALTPAAQTALTAALKNKALDPVALDIHGDSSYADTLLIVSGTSQRHVLGIAESIRVGMKQSGENHIYIEGLEKGHWVLLDYADIVVHVFHQPTREIYDLESLWNDAPRIPINITVTPNEDPAPSPYFQTGAMMADA